MNIKKFKNGNFNLRFEPDFDKDDYGREITSDNCRDRQECNALGLLAVLICNSMEMDFLLQDKAERFASDYILFNANTQMYYKVTFQDALDFFNGKSIKLEGFKDDDLEEYFKSYFEEDEESSTETTPIEITVYTRWNEDKKFRFSKGNYMNNNNLYVAVMSWDEEDKYWENYSDLTVNLMYDLDNNKAYLDANNCDPNIIAALEEKGLIVDMCSSASSGYCVYPLYIFTKEFLNGMEEY